VRCGKYHVVARGWIVENPVSTQVSCHPYRRRVSTSPRVAGTRMAVGIRGTSRAAAPANAGQSGRAD
jgi:hypothetical protein